MGLTREQMTTTLVSALTGPQLQDLAHCISLFEGFFHPGGFGPEPTPFEEFFRGDCSNPQWVRELFGDKDCDQKDDDTDEDGVPDSEGTDDDDDGIPDDQDPDDDGDGIPDNEENCTDVPVALTAKAPN